MRPYEACPMHIGLLAPDLNPHHGWGAYSLGLIAALRRADVRLSVVAAQDSPADAAPNAPRLLPSVSPLRRAFILHQLMALPQTRAHLRTCTHIHALVEPYAPLGAWLCGSRPLIMTAHGTYARLPERRFPNGMIYRQAFRRAHIIAVSSHTAGIVQALLPGTTPTVIPNGIDAARYLALPRQPAPEPTLLFVGGVKPRKGVLELIRAFARTRAQLPQARLWVVGALTLDPAYVASVQACIGELGLSEAVILHGRLDDDDLLLLYSRASAFVLPAQEVAGGFEGFGLALLEASAAGLPVISTRGSGTEDAVRDGETGLLVAQDDPQALVDTLLRVLTDPALAARLGRAGRAYAAAQTWDAVAARVIAVYEDARVSALRDPHTSDLA